MANDLYRALKNVHNDTPNLLMGVQAVSVNHDDCPAGEDTRSRLNIKVLPTGLIGHCFNCGGSGWYWYHKDAVLGIDDLIHEQSLTEKGTISKPNAAITPTLEYIANNAVPVKDMSILAWLYQQGLDDDDIVALGLKEVSGPHLILPLTSDITTGGIVTRCFSGGTDTRYKTYIPTGAIRGKMFDNKQRALVITEDILSAYRVQKTGVVDALAILGTTLSNTALLENLAGYRHFIIWLDEDFAGQEAVYKLAQVIRDYISHAQCYLVMKKQAKKLRDEEIAEEIHKWLKVIEGKEMSAHV